MSASSRRVFLQSSAATAALAATGRTLAFDPAAERFVGDSEADALLTRPARAPFVVPRAV